MRNIKVLYDYQAFGFQKFGGVSKCFCELIAHLPSSIKWEIAIKQSDNVHLWNNQLVKDLQSPKLDTNNFLTKRHFLGKGHLYDYFNKCFPWYPTTHNVNRNYAIKKIKEGNFDIFHPTFFDIYFLDKLNKKPFVLTIHDMMPEIFSSLFGENHAQIEAKRKMVSKASAIVAVSEQTKLDIIKYLDVDANKIEVIYHGGPQKIQIHDLPIISSPYFLYVGMRNAYKNFIPCLQEFARFSLNHPQVKLVCTGKPFTNSEYDSILQLGLKDKIVFQYVTDVELINLYTYAIGFIYPSLYEGFGMPILESYAYGCPCILNRKSCFPEIAKDAAIYFELDDKNQNMAEAMELIYNMNDEDKRQLLEIQEERLSDFSWGKSAEKLADLYKSIAM